VSAALQSTLPGQLAALAASRPDDVALREKRLGIWQEISWKNYLAEVAATGRMLRELGVGPGDHVAILSDNRPEWLFADLASQGIGARAVGIYQTNPPADVAYILQHSGSRVLFCEDQEQVDKVLELGAETPELQHIVVFDPRGTRSYDEARLRPWSEFIARGRELLATEPGWFLDEIERRRPAEPTMVVYTSGTTGQPKGALLSSKNVVATARSMAPVLGLQQGDSLLSYLPLCHVAEKIFSLFLPLSTGAVVHFGESIATVREDLRDVSPTIFLGVPRIWEKVHASVLIKMQDSSWLKRTLFDFFSRKGRAAAERRLAGKARLTDRVTRLLGDLLVFRALQEQLGLRRCHLPCSGAAPISRDLLLWFHGIGVPIVEGYGMTECGGVSHITPPGRAHLGSVGPVIEGTQCRIADDGEILLRGDNVFAGYLHNPEATEDTVRDGWLHTGDIGEEDANGYLRITGRKKEIIITAGGKNLSPEKIENALKTSPYLREAVAIGDGRKFISALVQVDYETTASWADRRDLPYTSYADLTGKDEVRALVGEEIGRANELLAHVEQVREFTILGKELHQDDGELTATQKVRRQAVMQIYGELIEAMYGGKAWSN